MPDDDDKMPDFQAIAARTLEIVGGRDKLIESITTDYMAMKAMWNKDVLTIGRILRAHLHVEHYLTEYLQHINPNLGDLDESRITFSQKLNLLRADDAKVAFLITGIRQLNKIRNRLAHDLEATVTEADAEVFLQGLFKAFREWNKDDPNVASATQPIDILEAFAEFSSAMLHVSNAPHALAFAQARKELSAPPG